MKVYTNCSNKKTRHNTLQKDRNHWNTNKELIPHWIYDVKNITVAGIEITIWLIVERIRNQFPTMWCEVRFPTSKLSNSSSYWDEYQTSQCHFSTTIYYTKGSQWNGKGLYLHQWPSLTHIVLGYFTKSDFSFAKSSLIHKTLFEIIKKFGKHMLNFCWSPYQLIAYSSQGTRPSASLIITNLLTCVYNTLTLKWLMSYVKACCKGNPKLLSCYHHAT